MSTPAPLPLIPEIYVSMVAGVCATCCHWDSDNPKVGKCLQIADVMEVAWTDGGPLYTESNFGCRLWVWKGK